MDNSKLYCHVNYHFSPKEPINPIIKKCMIDMFYNARGLVVDELNKHYEEWNAAYTKEVKGEFDPEYNHYIAEKQRECMRPFNEEFNKDKYRFLTFEMDSDEENGADLIGIFTEKLTGKKTTISMTMELINEKEWREYHATH